MVIKHMFNRYKPDKQCYSNGGARAKIVEVPLRLGPTANPADLFTKTADIASGPVQISQQHYLISQ
jgi:hypothetical protein